MEINVIKFAEKLALIDEKWSPGIVASLNDYHIKLAKIQGEFVWHTHSDTDEAFIVLEGSMQIALRDRTLELTQGEMCVIPRGVEHRPTARDECHILLIEPAGTLNTGDTEGDRTIQSELWI